MRYNPKKETSDGYYRLVESYRNAEDRVCHRTIVNIGFIEDEASTEQLVKIQKHLTNRYHLKQYLFEESDPVVIKLAEDYWQRIIASKKLDIDFTAHRSRMVDADTLKHTNAREIGAEWIGYNCFEQLGIGKVLSDKGFTEEQVQLAATQIISRAVYPASELETTRWIKENSAIAELTGYNIDKLTKDKLYQSALSLYDVKDTLEQHLSKHTNELFDIQDKIILYDLTNTYFEGEKRNSTLARFGRSKEKRNDAKIVVLALVVNIHGFIKYSAIHEGNIADCNTLSQMIDSLSKRISAPKSIIVLDAGIATEENLQMIAQKGFYYLCVSRSKLKNYTVVKDRLTVLLETKSKKEIRLKSISTANNTDYYLEVKSEAKQLKEAGMKSQYEERYESELQKIQQSLHKKSGVKQVQKVYERIGRAKQKYPSVQLYYDIEVTVDEQTQKVTAVTWQKNEEKHYEKTQGLGVYFLRTNLNMKDEVVIWNVYNTIREIENTFRTLKTDLDLRPVIIKVIRPPWHICILA